MMGNKGESSIMMSILNINSYKHVAFDCLRPVLVSCSFTSGEEEPTFIASRSISTLRLHLSPTQHGSVDDALPPLPL
jgi:hypothetical protein